MDPMIIGALIALSGGAFTAGVTLFIAYFARRNVVDIETHKARLREFPVLIQATEPLSIYSPERLNRDQIRNIGLLCRNWYFGGGGLLLSEAARVQYFEFVYALMAAGGAPKELRCPAPADYLDIARPGSIAARIANLPGYDNRFVDWEFGESGKEQGDGEAEPFGDFLVLQWFSSQLRTQLTVDLKARRRPA